MNHAAFVAHEAGLPYRLRSYFVWQLDDEHYEALNPGNHLYCMCGYSLDAVEEIPAGSMVSIGYAEDVRRGVGSIHYTPPRGVTLKEQQEEDAAVNAMIEEIIRENSPELFEGKS